MRPEILFPLFAPVTSLKGVGPRLGKLFERLGIEQVVDLLWHVPTDIIDRRFQPKIADAPAGAIATMTVTVEAHEAPHNKRQPYRVRCHDETGTLFLVFFHGATDYLERLLPLGATRVVSGRVEHFNNQIQITHPDHVLAPDEAARLSLIEPVYGLTAGLSLRVVQKAVAGALLRAHELPEWLDPAYLHRENWLSWRQALGKVHAPEDIADLSPAAPARQRLAFDELLANQLALGLMREPRQAHPGPRPGGDGRAAPQGDRHAALPAHR